VTTATADAPGKLFVAGEYAVLCGAPALVAGIDRRARVRLARHAGPRRLRVVSLAEAADCSIDQPEAGELPGGDVGAVLAAVRAARAWVELPSGTLEVMVDSRPFLDAARKLGLGRSAATVTATVAVLLAAAGRFERLACLEIAVAAHALFQAGQGSGGDVAAAVHGGLVEVRREAGRLAVADRRLPPGTELVVGWTGEAASTVPLLHRFAAASGEELPALRELCRVAEDAATAVGRGDRRALFASVDRSATLLAELGHETGLPIVTPVLRRLVETARQVGAVAKPSGAGGGDCGIALADSEAKADAVRAAWRRAGIVPLGVALSATGVQLERVERAPPGGPGG
jgi:phosphomevalonate kinase